MPRNMDCGEVTYSLASAIEKVFISCEQELKPIATKRSNGAMEAVYEQRDIAIDMVLILLRACVTRKLTERCKV